MNRTRPGFDITRSPICPPHPKAQRYACLHIESGISRPTSSGDLSSCERTEAGAIALITVEMRDRTEAKLRPNPTKIEYEVSEADPSS
mmetsp:Transcript_38294/g.70257  ORF Transcript_38294/g.70257 Transcript_38294/m.70257 type:complete len:88 (+) Transcript_38294:439-702(+)